MASNSKRITRANTNNTAPAVPANAMDAKRAPRKPAAAAATTNTAAPGQARKPATAATTKTAAPAPNTTATEDAPRKRATAPSTNITAPGPAATDTKRPARKPAAATTAPDPATTDIKRVTRKTASATATATGPSLKRDLYAPHEVSLNKDAHWGCQVPAATPDMMQDDFAAMGMAPLKVEEMMKKDEPVKVDGLAQIWPHPGGEFVPGTGPLPKRKLNAKYKGLVMVEKTGTSKTDWTLYDPYLEQPLNLGSLPPKFKKYLRYTPGNKKVVLFNAGSKSYNLATTPESLRGKAVEYDPKGLKLHDLTPAQLEALGIQESLDGAPPVIQESSTRDDPRPDNSALREYLARAKMPPPARPSKRGRDMPAIAIPDPEVDLAAEESAPAPSPPPPAPKKTCTRAPPPPPRSLPPREGRGKRKASEEPLPAPKRIKREASTMESVPEATASEESAPPPPPPAAKKHKAAEVLPSASKRVKRFTSAAENVAEPATSLERGEAGDPPLSKKRKAAEEVEGAPERKRGGGGAAAESVPKGKGVVRKDSGVVGAGTAVPKAKRTRKPSKPAITPQFVEDSDE